jgi:hypothetical protein
MHQAAKRTCQHDEKQQTGLEKDICLKPPSEELDMVGISDRWLLIGSAYAPSIAILCLSWS